MSCDETWDRIEREAREQVLSELTRDENTPLVFGAPIAWSECMQGRTCGVSELHRVGFPQVGHAFTACGELIPAPVRWLPLSPAIVRTKKPCTYCQSELKRIQRERVAA